MGELARFEPQAVLARRRAGWNRLAIALPVVALMGAVWLGISGRGPNTSGTDGLQGNLVAGASIAPTAPVPAPASQPGATAYPAAVLGLEVRRLADLDSVGADADAAVAVVGWYIAWPSLGCPTPGDVEVPGFVTELGADADVRTFCDRSGVLVATPNPAGSMNVGGANDHPYGSGAASALPVSLTPGVVVPPELSAESETKAQVILIGRIVPSSQSPDHATTGRKLLVDRVAWANGVGLAETTSILPRLLDRAPQQPSATRDQLAAELVGPTGPILLETLVDQPTLAAVDPHAAALVAAASPDARRIWYRRTLGPDASPEGERWAAIDDTADVAIAGGWIDIAPGLAADGANALPGG